MDQRSHEQRQVDRVGTAFLAALALLITAVLGRLVFQYLAG